MVLAGCRAGFEIDLAERAMYYSVLKTFKSSVAGHKS